MDLDQIKEILNLVREHELAEFEIEQEGLRLKIRRDHVGAPDAGRPVYSAAHSSVPSHPQQPASAPPGPLAPAAEDGEIELAVVKSPIVGTFYRSPEPGASAFVEVGASVKKGQVLCIVEAMKLMNEIDSEYEGEIVKIYVENGQPVQYGERLFAIRTR
jgi:acetyl-CoA carboxylase biotin carboxyl carrier protein